MGPGRHRRRGAAAGRHDVPHTASLKTELKERDFVVEPPPGMSGPPHQSRINYPTHEPFCWFLRLENVSDQDVDVTVRIFIAPEDTPADPAHGRRAWIEMDKFIHPVPAERRVVVFRPDVFSSVIKKPADLDPANPVEPEPGGEEDGGSYCQCGWPYPLLLPRGTEAGMPFRVVVLVTDAAAGRVPQPGGCGSMSFCGAADRYSDARDMGYPFARPFEQWIADTLLPLDNAAGLGILDRLGLTGRSANPEFA
jgi:Hemocyanin, ig-like domain